MWLEVNESKMQGQRLSIKFLGFVCLGKAKVISKAIKDKIQPFSYCNDSKALIKDIEILFRSTYCTTYTNSEILVPFGKDRRQVGMDEQEQAAFAVAKKNV